MAENDVASQINGAVAALMAAARTDKTLREELLRDPTAALQRYGVPPMPGMAIRFVDSDRELVVPLPRYEGP